MCDEHETGLFADAVDDRVRDSGVAAAELDWGLQPAHVLDAARRSRAVLVRRGLVLALVAVVLVAIFVVPLPELHLFRTAGTLPSRSSRPKPPAPVTTTTTGALDVPAGFVHGGWKIESLPSGWEDVSAVTCTTASDCVALGNTDRQRFIARSTDGGRSWTTEATSVAIDTSSVLRCFSASTCVVYGASTFAAARFVVTHDGGATWSTPRGLVADDALDSVSCPSETECFALVDPSQASSGPVDYVFRASGSLGRWTKVSAIWSKSGFACRHRLDGSCEATPIGRSILSCPTTTVCFAATAAAGPNGNLVFAIWHSDDAGQSWQLQRRVDLENPDELVCTTSSDCILSGSDYLTTIGFTEDSTWSTSDGGAAWRSGRGLEVVGGMACTTPERCWLVASAPSTTLPNPNVIEYSSDGGRTWTTQVADYPTEHISPTFLGIACAPEQPNARPTCIAFGGVLALLNPA
jgi:hypothetical protein